MEARSADYSATDELTLVSRSRIREMQRRGFSVVSVRDEHSVWMQGGTVDDRGWQHIAQPTMRVLHGVAGRFRR